MSYEVNEPILNSPFDEPSRYWFIREGYEPELKEGRRPAIVYPPREGNTEWELGKVLKLSSADQFAPGYEMILVNHIREQVKQWRRQNYPGVTRTTLELLEYWNREGREHRLFFAQREAVETIIFLTESRADFRQGIHIPQDIPVDGTLKAFIRYACKMATGSGKTTVMAMLAAWSILNKISDRSNTKFSDIILIICPNVTIKSRLQELNLDNGEASLYRTRDLVPSHLMDKLRQGKVLVTNWHIFEKRTPSIVGNDSAKVVKAGVKTTTTEVIKIAAKNETARGTRYLTLESLEQQIALGQIKVVEEKKDKQGNLKEVKVEITRYLESDAAWIKRILTQEVGNKRNILVFNDEAHHAYRIYPNKTNENEEEELEEYEEKEATIWVEGLDRIHKYRGINFCVDLSATPYYLKSSKQNTNKPFEWVVSDFSLMDAIESGLVKIPQLPVRDTTGADVSDLAYFNIWQWIINKMTPAERGKGINPKPEAILKYAQHPITLLGVQWEQIRQEWIASDDPRPPVFIIVCKNTNIAKCLYEWIAEDIKPGYLPSCTLKSLRNTETETNTIRVDSKVVEELESGNSKSDESKWMRLTLDTIGKTQWPKDDQGRNIYPEEFAQLAEKLARPLHPPGRDIKCVISVGMLTEGWNCSTVKHIIGIRPFQSQLLCEQVVGRGLRRRNYDLTEDNKFAEETSTIFGVPFEVVPFKANPQGAKRKPEKRYHVYSVPQKSQYRLEFPRVEGYTQAVQNRVTVDWDEIASLTIDPFKIAPEVQVKATLANNQGRPSVSGPGKLESIDLNPYRQGKRLQQLVFELAADLTRTYCASEQCEAPPHVLFPQLRKICDRYLTEKVKVVEPAAILDVFLSPYYGWVIEKLSEAIRPDISAGEAPEIPKYEAHRGNGSTDDINFFTGKPVREVVKSHLNGVVADTHQWEQAAAYIIDTHPATKAFVKNERLGFAIPYFHNGEYHDYIPDFIIRLNTPKLNYIILETKGWDELREVKEAAAQRWCNAINTDGKYGHWQYFLSGLSKVKEGIDQAIREIKA
ncbi:MAG: type III restriction endonuclease subunit R [Microcystis aeruginosa Ma_AC_P_19900807_S299]|jgi:type III restriction enzyme|uniref:Type III restriction endonuclease subunit R n=1 Tax=Microcystis aeruginosa Ma_SC_T_19800800_S464 TaxID=2486257 RepID=A0A552DVD0_MICAE|nr:MAG: type III restriction endonuclease subunit R [Microcystis aeruginosa Ma_AC_P_19900807_S299]TRU26156.1 MAG: type III restriction endonuclease subunit R [Microcystis aeruginosa Ma_SC_T_19800800_S464]